MSNDRDFKDFIKLFESKVMEDDYDEADSAVGATLNRFSSIGGKVVAKDLKPVEVAFDKAFKMLSKALKKHELM